MSLLHMFKTNPKPELPEEELRKHQCAFTGHRPEKLTGQESYIIVELRKEIKAAVEAGYTTFITGCSRGVDLWAADIVIQMRRYNKNLKLVCAIPFEGFDEKWPVDWRKHLKLVCKQADRVHVLSKEYTPEAYQNRNIWMIKRVSRVIAVCNGEPSGTMNTITFARSQNTPVHLIQI